MPTIRTTMRPGDEIVVTDAEYEQLLDLGLIYDGTPPVEPADAFDTRVAQRLADSDSATRTAFDTIYADVVDGDIAPILSNPESAASVALRVALESRGGRAKLPGAGRGVLLPGKANGLLYGVNLGIGPATIDTFVMWRDSYDLAYQKRKLDKIAALGCNSVRIQGCYSAYAVAATQYVGRVRQVIDYAHSLGLRVLFAFLNNGDDSSRSNLNSSLRTQYAAYFKALTDVYGGHPMMLAWDIGNELRAGQANIKTLIGNAVTDLRALDPVTPITSSIIGVFSGVNPEIADVEACGVDFQDIHIYNDPYNGFNHNWLDDFKAITAKPILFSEFGSNLDPAALGGPHLPSQTMQAAYMRSVRRYASDGQVMGFMPWAIEDDSPLNLFGLYDAAGNPREQLAEFLRFPSTANAAAQDAVDYRTSPVVIADFAQANTSAGMPAQPLGGAPVITAGTWGITNRHGVVATPVAGGQNVIAWEANTADPDLHMEIGVAAPHTAGIILRATDSTHWLAVVLETSMGGLAAPNAGQPGLYLLQNNGGTFTGLGSWKLTTATRFGAKIRVVLRGSSVFVHYLGKFLGRVDNVTFNQNATKHGLYLYRAPDFTGDSGSVFKRFNAQVPLRLY